MTASNKLEQTQHAWATFQHQAHIKRPSTETEYEQLHNLLDDLTNRYAMDDPTFGPLIDLIATYMLGWENQHDPWAKTPCAPRDALASLMQDRNATQYQLEKAGVAAQSTLSQILSGKRGISKNIAKKLAAFFGVSSAVFL